MPGVWWVGVGRVVKRKTSLSEIGFGFLVVFARQLVACQYLKNTDKLTRPLVGNSFACQEFISDKRLEFKKALPSLVITTLEDVPEPTVLIKFLFLISDK